METLAALYDIATTCLPPFHTTNDVYTRSMALKKNDEGGETQQINRMIDLWAMKLSIIQVTEARISAYSARQHFGLTEKDLRELNKLDNFCNLYSLDDLSRLCRLKFSDDVSQLKMKLSYRVQKIMEQEQKECFDRALIMRHVLEHFVKDGSLATGLLFVEVCAPGRYFYYMKCMLNTSKNLAAMAEVFKTAVVEQFVDVFKKNLYNVMSMGNQKDILRFLEENRDKRGNTARRRLEVATLNVATTRVTTECSHRIASAIAHYIYDGLTTLDQLRETINENNFIYQKTKFVAIRQEALIKNETDADSSEYRTRPEVESEALEQAVQQWCQENQENQELENIPVNLRHFCV